MESCSSQHLVESQAPDKNSKMLWPVSSLSKSLVGKQTKIPDQSRITLRSWAACLNTIRKQSLTTPKSK